MFDFDQYEIETKSLLIDALNRHGIPAGLESSFRRELGSTHPLPAPDLLESWRYRGDLDDELLEYEKSSITKRVRKLECNV